MGRFEYEELYTVNFFGMDYWYFKGEELSSDLITALNEIGKNGWEVSFVRRESEIIVKRKVD